MPEQLIDCPNPECQLPLRPPATLGQIEFPDDVDAVESLLDLTFNTVPHFCGHSFSLLRPVVARYRARHALAIVGGRERPLSGPLASWDITWLSDYNGLRATVVSWLAAEGEAFWEMLKDGSFFALDRATQVKAASPIRLLILAREVAARRQFAASTEQEDADLESLSKLTTALVVEQINRLTFLAGEQAGTAELPELVRRHVPRTCLDNAVLDELLRRCDDDPFQSAAGGDGTANDSPGRPDRDRVARAFRAELAAAVAHRIAGRPNPREANWAAMLIALWDLSQRDWTEIDDRFFLDREALQATVAFSTLLGAAMSMTLPKEKFDLRDALSVIGEFHASYVELMQRAGYDRAFDESVTGLFIQVVRASGKPVDPELLLDSIDEMIRQETDDDYDDLRSRRLGAAASIIVDRLTSARPEKTAEFAETTLDGLRRRNDLIATTTFVYNATEWLNKKGSNDTAVHLVEAVLPDVQNDAVELEQHEQVNFWNEVGNTFRYADRWDESLTAYEIAAEACDDLPDEARRRRIIDRNLAIVLRDAGLLTDSIAILQRLAEASPDDPGLLDSIAVFRIRTGQPALALPFIDRALAEPSLPQSEAAHYLMTRADAMRLLGRPDDAISDLRQAWRLADQSGSDLRLRIAGLAVWVWPASAEANDFRDRCKEYIEKTAEAGLRGATEGSIGAFYALAEDRLETCDLAGARRLLERVIPQPRRPEDARIGELSLAWGWLLVEEGSDDAWPWLHAAMQSFDSTLPRGSEGEFALPWLSVAGRSLDRLLRLVPRATSSPADLLSLYELANGLELTAGVEGTGSAACTDWLSRVSSHPAASTLDLVALLDGEHEVTAVVVPARSARQPVAVRVGLSAADLDAAVAKLAVLNDANPVAPHRIDASMRRWWQAMAVLADTLRPHLSDGAELVILPGRRLAGAPLHLAGWPELPLIASRPVSVCPNLRVLLGAPDASRPRRTGLAVIPKQGDREEFIAALRGISVELAAATAPATVIADLDASADAVLSLSGEVDEMVFLCHGVNSAGPDQGAGLCVAAHGHLPINPLPLEDDPALADFALSWSDLITLRNAPDVVVSIACSSGRILIGPGGTRLGLEQGFLSRGGSAIVSPLWNVDQTASLAWLSAFYARHQPGRLTDLSHAHQAACLAVLADHPHPYLWGPFLLTRRLPQGEPDA